MEKTDEIMKIDSINSFIFFITVMVEMPVTKHPPHRSRRAVFQHRACYFTKLFNYKCQVLFFRN